MRSEGYLRNAQYGKAADGGDVLLEAAWYYLRWRASVTGEAMEGWGSEYDLEALMGNPVLVKREPPG